VLHIKIYYELLPRPNIVVGDKQLRKQCVTLVNVLG